MGSRKVSQVLALGWIHLDIGHKIPHSGYPWEYVILARDLEHVVAQGALVEDLRLFSDRACIQVALALMPGLSESLCLAGSIANGSSK
jgi:hypothetical protein